VVYILVGESKKMDLKMFNLIVYTYCKELLALFWYKIIVASFLWIVWYITLVYEAQEIAITSLFVLMIVDFILWLWRAFHNKKVSSFKMKLWLWKFVVYMFVIIAWYGADMLIFKTNMSWGFHYIFILYLWTTELISIIEHTNALWINLPFAKDLKKFQNQLSEEGLLNMIKDNLKFKNK